MKTFLVKRLTAAAMLAATLLAVGNASAEIKQLSAPLDITLPYTLTGTGAFWDLYVPKFDTSLGDLYGIRVWTTNPFTVDALMTAEGGIFLPPFFIDGWSFSSLSYFQLKGPSIDDTTVRGVTDSGGGNYGFQHGASVTKSDRVDSKPIFISAPSDLADYLGSGTVHMTFTAGVTTGFGGLPATLGGFTTQFSTITAAGIAQASNSTFYLEYYYNAAAVPEVETWAMLLGGLGIIGFLARRRSR